MASAGRPRRPIVVRRGSTLRALFALGLLVVSLAAVWLCWPATLAPALWSPGRMDHAPVLDGQQHWREWRGATGGRLRFGGAEGEAVGTLRWGMWQDELWLAVTCRGEAPADLAVHLEAVGGGWGSSATRAGRFVVLAIPGTETRRTFHGGTPDAPAVVLFPALAAISTPGRGMVWEARLGLAELGLAADGRFQFMLEVRGPSGSRCWPAGAAPDQPVTWSRGRLEG